MKGIIGFIISIKMSVCLKEVVENVVVYFLMGTVFDGKLTKFLKGLIQ